MIEGRWMIPTPYRAGAWIRSNGAEIDIAYNNGWRETVTVRPASPHQMPFDGKIVAYRSL